MTPAVPLITLDALTTGAAATVVRVSPGDAADDGAGLARRLMAVSYTHLTLPTNREV